jgi:LEA14-like dessication related protein
MGGKAVVLTVFLVGIVVVAPLAYGAGFLYAVNKLEWHTPTLTVSRDGWTIYVALNFKVENPTSIPLPTLEAVVNITLDDHILFYAESYQIGSLNPHSTATISLTAAINLDLLGDLFWILVKYLAGTPITMRAYFKLSVHLLVDFPVLEKEISHTFELY